MKRILFLFLLFSLNAPLAAQQEATTGQVMRLHRAAIGGVDAVLSYTTATMEYSLSFRGGQQGTLKAIHGVGGLYRESRKVGRTLTQAVYNDGQVIIINNSTGRGLSYHDAGGKGLDLYYLNLYRSSASLFPLFLAESQLGGDLMLIGSGSQGYSLRATYPDGAIRTFTLNAGAELMRDVTRITGEGANLSITRSYRNYRYIGGANLAGSIEVDVDGSLTVGNQQRQFRVNFTITLKQAQGNTNPDSSLFYVEGPDFVPTGTLLEKGSFAFVYNGSTPVGDDPESIQAFDINEDGFIDLVTGNDGDTTLLRGDGSGSFPSSAELPGGGGSNEFALPVNWDGEPGIELLVASTASPGKTVLVVGQDANGNYSRKRELPAGDFPEALAAADMNNDGAVDLVSIHNRSGDAWVHLGDGASGVASVVLIELEGRGENLALSDYTKDGFIDIIAVDQKHVYAVANQGGAEYSVQHTLEAGPLPFCVAAADFNSDGYLDIVVGNGGIFRDTGDEDIALLMGKAGGFEAATFISSGGSISSLTVADFDADGDADVAAASFGTHEIVLLENRRGELVYSGALPAGWAPAAVTSADFNGDGKPDLAAANEHDDSVSIWLNGK